jgi:hypothetical protein
LGPYIPAQGLATPAFRRSAPLILGERREGPPQIPGAARRGNENLHRARACTPHTIEDGIMDSSGIDKSDHRGSPPPGTSADAAADGERAQCDMLEFWRRCKRARCRKHHCCAGDPYLCFGRKHAEMPRDHKDWRRVEALAKAMGTVTAEEALRAAPKSEEVTALQVIEWPPRDRANQEARGAASERTGPASPDAGAAGQAACAAAADDERPLAVRLQELEQKMIREGAESRHRVEARLRMWGALAPGESIWSHRAHVPERPQTAPKVWWPTGNVWKRFGR